MYNHPPEGGVKQIKMKTLKLEVGKTYRNRKGKEVRIARKDDKGRYPYIGSNGQWYAENGRWQAFAEEDPEDLIEEVPSETARHTFAIPDGVKEITLDYFGNRIVVEMVPEAGKRWNPETMQVEEIPEIDRILEWVETNIKDGYYNHEDVAEAIEEYLKHKEAKK